MSDNREFIRSMENATFEIIKRTVNKVEKACLYLEGEAKKECPVDLGQLRASITHEVNFNEQEIKGSVGSNLEYAPYVHNGTGIYAKDGDGRKTPWTYTVKSGKYAGTHVTEGQKPNPFLENARNNSINEIEKILGK